MFTKFLILCILYAASGLVESSTSYDQSQTGDLNVQVDLKGLHIIALMKGGKEEYVDYDYAYDYSEMTIKPLNGTTPKPLNVTSSAPDKGNATTSAPGTVAYVYENTTALPLLTTTVTDTPQNNSKGNSTAIENGTNDENAPTAFPNILNSTDLNSLNSSSTCRKGYMMNQKGECELKMQNAGTNALLKLVKLSQKLKLRRERNPTNAVKPYHNT